MRYVSEDRLKQIAAMPASVFEAPASEIINYLISKECQELQESSWMTLYEFLKSGFEGWCWINWDGDVVDAHFKDGEFYYSDSAYDDSYSQEEIAHVMPIHEPEPPR